jgi:hypothetical protein
MAIHIREPEVDRRSSPPGALLVALAPRSG